MEKEEKLLIKYFFAMLLAFAMFYTVLTRSSFYDEDGLPSVAAKGGALRIAGENVAGDYALLKLAESGKTPAEFYDPSVQTAFIKDRLGAEGEFRSFSAPTMPFALVPLSELSYGEFYSMWLTWGLFLFSASLLCLFPFFQALLLSFAFPALFYAFSFGGGGLFYAAALIFILTSAERFPKTAGIVGGLTFVAPFYGVVSLAALFVEKRKKAAAVASVFGAVILFLAASRYGKDSFAVARTAAFAALNAMPCAFASFRSGAACAGMSVPAAWTIYAVVVLYCAAVGKAVFKSRTATKNVRNAFLCAAAALATPWFSAGEYGVLCAAAAFLICDLRERGSSGIFEKIILCGVFFAPYADPFFVASFRFPVIPLIGAGLAAVCRKRAF